MRLQSAVVCGHCERRIEGEQHHRHTNVITPSISPYERMASLERDELRSLREDGFAGTNVSPHEKMATPERDKPRSLRNDGFAGTKVSPYEKMASPVQTSQ